MDSVHLLRKAESLRRIGEASSRRHVLNRRLDAIHVRRECYHFAGLAYRTIRKHFAIAELDEFDRLSPRDPAKWIIYDCRAIAEMEIGDFDTALSWTRKAVQHPNAHAVPYIHHVVVLNKLGQTEETRMAGVELMRLMPGFSLKKVPNHMGVVNRHLDLYLDGLRAAGIPEE